MVLTGFNQCRNYATFWQIVKLTIPDAAFNIIEIVLNEHRDFIWSLFIVVRISVIEKQKSAQNNMFKETLRTCYHRKNKEHRFIFCVKQSLLMTFWWDHSHKYGNQNVANTRAPVFFILSIKCMYCVRLCFEYNLIQTPKQIALIYANFPRDS